ncbi:hypothetical protein A1O1_01798 [Capronia coronata CBS 617.96]|uniref:Choline transport protein n=1 Tax=Capronia coronata CBS 617.96 TaxID=1182541 RepID=W9YVX3_9EURO|nr:uncharacterized protein A1O1_01798 [Capronia coronata CBS 617.96]EXJ93406.1 hypothetical protein A1O1_01798 [Capronia coronata CBS 617.96]
MASTPSSEVAADKTFLGESNAERVASIQDGEAHLHVSHKYTSHVQMKKQFGTIATLGIAFSILNSWVAESGSMLGPIALGGPVTIIWGCVAGAVFTAILCASFAEMASALPGAGGPYHYTYVVCGPGHRKFLSFVAGWSNTVAWWFIASSAALFLASFISGMAVLTYPDYVPTTWQVWLIYVGIVVLNTVIAIGGNRIMSLLTSASLYWSLASFLVCLITTVAMHAGKPYEPASFVFGNFSNESGWSSAGTAFVIGWMLSTYNVPGLLEEMERPQVEVPRAMVGAILTGFVTSFTFLVALLFCVTDMNEIVTSPTGVPVLVIFYQSTGSQAAAIALTCLIFVSIMFSEIGGILISGRTTWAFARDNGMPFSEYLSHLDERTQSPIRATPLSSFLSIAYGAIYIGSPVAFSSIVASSIMMLITTYCLPQAVLAIRGRHHLPPRPFDLGRAGWTLNALAPIMVVFAFVILSFPTTLPVTVETMNYLCVIVVGVWVLIIGFYFTVKKGEYQGPVLGIAPHD